VLTGCKEELKNLTSYGFLFQETAGRSFVDYFCCCYLVQSAQLLVNIIDIWRQMTSSENVGLQNRTSRR